MRLRSCNIFFPLIATILVVLSSCKKSPTPQFHYEYFGYNSGQFVIYDVIEITHDKDLNLHDTVNYQLKTVWGEEYIDNQERNGREFKRYIRTSQAENWQLSDVWHGLIDNTRAELVEENQRRVKLVFSPTYSKEWKANASNIDEDYSCYYRDIHQDTVINGMLFDSTLVVETDLEPNKILDVRVYEVYAKGVGLIYKHYKHNRYFGFNDPEVGEGKELYYSIVEYGLE